MRHATVTGVLTALAAGALVVAPMASVSAYAADQACSTDTEIFSPLTPTALDKLQYQQAWTRTKGKGVVVAVVDSGIDVRNKHLRSVVIGGINLVGDGENPKGFTDLTGHGTAIAGQIAAQLIPESGVVGLAPDARLLSVRVFRATDDGAVREGFGPKTSRIAQGIVWATDAGAQIINVSMSQTTNSPALASAVSYATSRGSLVVASAGNANTADDDTPGPRYPAAYDGALAVSAADDAGVVDDASISGPHVQVAAPGKNVLTSATGSGDCMYATEGPATSYATGYASAAAALVASVYPSESPAEWAYRLMATATRSSPDVRDDSAGWGVIQPLDAIRLLPSAGTRGPASPFFDASDNSVAPPRSAVTPSRTVSDFIVTQQTMLLVVVIGLTLLGTIAVVIVLRARRRPSVLGGPAHGAGLLDRETTAP
ncbi:MAG: S8 family serine peptidase [Microbacteriaceae bacterium]